MLDLDAGICYALGIKKGHPVMSLSKYVVDIALRFGIGIARIDQKLDVFLKLFHLAVS